ncbi:unnamed protein product [Allacma fusca]|uniref:Uncharacterized protein n=1 Tax=Allacma fusca TaxID=39272 RepID=A0A8J2P884_9HEXA|nr:unnamed protein product [Allacma fusca]
MDTKLGLGQIYFKFELKGAGDSEGIQNRLGKYCYLSSGV